MRFGKNGFRFGFPDRVLEREPLARDIRVRNRRRGASKLIQERLPRAIVNSPPCLAGIAVETLKRARQKGLIIGHRYSYPAFRTLCLERIVDKNCVIPLRTGG